MKSERSGDGHPDNPQQEEASSAATPSSELYSVDANDPDSQLLDRAELPAEDLAQINELMKAMGDLRAAEERLSDASLEFMRLGKTDMKALHFLIVAQHTEQIVTATTLAAHLGITSASTTKLLDRLERGEHIIREPHPEDRRSTSVHITAATHAAAMETVGAQQARRFHAAARLNRAERDVVIDFLRDTAHELSHDMDWAQT